MDNLFGASPDLTDKVDLDPGAVVLRKFALGTETQLIAALRAIIDEAPFRRMVTPGGQTMSVTMTNCGSAGWVSDSKGYRYDPIDPLTSKPWPQLPVPFLELARRASMEAGYGNFEPDACLINRYAPGARLTLHEGHLRKPTRSETAMGWSLAASSLAKNSVSLSASAFRLGS